MRYYLSIVHIPSSLQWQRGQVLQCRPTFRCKRVQEYDTILLPCRLQATTGCSRCIFIDLPRKVLRKVVSGTSDCSSMQQDQHDYLWKFIGPGLRQFKLNVWLGNGSRPICCVFNAVVLCSMRIKIPGFSSGLKLCRPRLRA